jgi:hypothetical protein
MQVPKVSTPLVKIDPFPATTFDAGPVLAIIARLSWRKPRPKTRWGHPQIPHQYVVRGRPPGNDTDYEELFYTIQQHGREERYGRAVRRYMYPGDGRKYWAMTTEVEVSGVINRMLIEDDLDRLRREGQIEC